MPLDNFSSSPSSSKRGTNISSENSFKDRCLRELDPALSHAKRIAAAYAISQEIGRHSVETLETLWTVAADLTSKDADVEARKAGFALLKASTSHPGTLIEREKLYDMIVTPIHSSEVSLQISALEGLTSDGQNLSPFEHKLPLFLNSLLKELFRAAEIARENRARDDSSKARSNQGLIRIVSGIRPSEGTPGKDASSRESRKQPGLPEQRILLRTFYLIANIITRKPDAFHGAQLDILIERVTEIATKTTAPQTLHGVVKILLAIITNAELSKPSLEPMIYVLCNIYGIGEVKFEDELWRCLSRLLQSKHQSSAIHVLLKLLKTLPENAGIPGSPIKARGALLTIQRTAGDPNPDLEKLLVGEIQSVAWGLKAAYTLDAEMGFLVMTTVDALLSNHNIALALVSEDWSILAIKLDEVLQMQPTLATSGSPEGRFEQVNSTSPLYQVIRRHLSFKPNPVSQVSDQIQRIAERLMFLLGSHWTSLDQGKMHLLTNALVSLALYVPAIWPQAIECLWHQGLLDPENANWVPHFRFLVNNVFTNPTIPEKSSSVLLQKFSMIFPTLRLNERRSRLYADCLRHICQVLSRNGETGLPGPIVDSLADVLLQCSTDIDKHTFNTCLEFIEKASELSSSDPTTATKISERTAGILIKIFLRCIPESSFKVTKTYTLLLMMVKKSKPTRVRLSVMKLLTRLRCNSAQAIEIVTYPDSQGLAAILCRTEATASTGGSSETSSNRTSLYEQPQQTRPGRSSTADSSRAVRSGSANKSANFKDQLSRPTPPLWMYDASFEGLPERPQRGPSQVVFSKPPDDENPNVLDLGLWLDTLISILENEKEWEIYSYVLVHLPSQLSNRSLFARRVKQLQTIHNIVVDQLEKKTFYKPPLDTGIVAGDIALCLFHTLTTLVAYHEHLSRREIENTVRSFSAGIDRWDRAGKCCIHALALCCHEIPHVIDRHIFAIIQKMQQKITQSDLAVDILEFLHGLAGLPDACSSATARVPDSHASDTGDFYRTVFGICVRYLENARDQSQKLTGDQGGRMGLQSNRQSNVHGEFSRASIIGPNFGAQKALSEYVSTLAYHVITSWFLSIDVSQRAQHVGWIAKGLAWKDRSGREQVDEQSQVILDMMHRTAYSDLGETEPGIGFHDLNETPIKKMWLLGMSIITVEILPSTNSGQFTKRQASGTTHASYYHNTANPPAHLARGRNMGLTNNPKGSFDVYPNHMFLQLASTIAPVPIPLQPIVLPDDEATQRSIRNFDLTDTVDGHKAGVVYVGEKQSIEAEILANSRGTDAYDAFLSGLGTKVKLQDAKFNTRGLDRESNTDGTHTYAWRDRVTEIVFHVTTMMPTDEENDHQGVNKKKHIGNDRVKIIYNDSREDFDFNTFPSDMNDVNIVITPEAHTCGGRFSTARKRRRKSLGFDGQEPSLTELFGYYNVQTRCSSKFPPLSPAASPKMISADALPGFVRHLALNCSAFSQVWSAKLGQGEYVSSWRTRLREIMKLRRKHVDSNTSANVAYPMPDSPPPKYEGDSWTGNVAMGGMAEPDQLLMSLDFTRWT